MANRIAAGAVAVCVEKQIAGGAVVDDPIVGIVGGGAGEERIGVERARGEGCEYAMVERVLSPPAWKSAIVSTLLAPGAVVNAKMSASPRPTRTSLPSPPFGTLAPLLPIIVCANPCR